VARVELDVGRNRLRQALATLRRLLEPPGMPPDSVLAADRQTVGLADDAVSCDVHEFERLLKLSAVSEALACYRGELLPGYLDEWVEDERSRLSALHARALLRESAAIDKAPVRQPLPSAAATPRPSRFESGAPFRSVPSYVNTLFGREADTRLVLDALARQRLVTLTGLGGFGKTRLAVEAARIAEGFDIVAFVALSECGNAGLIADHIRSALRMEASQEDALARSRRSSKAPTCCSCSTTSSISSTAVRRWCWHCSSGCLACAASSPPAACSMFRASTRSPSRLWPCRGPR
jgi:hypothetical protein